MDWERKQFPAGVKIIAILFYITGVLEVIFSFLLIFMLEILGKFLNVSQLISIFGQISTIIGINLSPFGQISTVFGIIIFGLAVLTFLIGRGLGRLKKWSRILTIIFGFIELMTSVIMIINDNLTGGFIGLLISSIIPLYLLFSERVGEAFTYGV
jgi:hypothetical protein